MQQRRHNRRQAWCLPKPEARPRSPILLGVVAATAFVALLVLVTPQLRTPARMRVEGQPTSAPLFSAPTAAPPTPTAPAPTPTLYPPEPGIVPLGAPIEQPPPVQSAPVVEEAPPAEPPPLVTLPCWEGPPRPNPDDLALCWDGVPWRKP